MYNFVSIEGIDTCWTLYGKNRIMDGIGEEKLNVFLPLVANGSLVLDKRPAFYRSDYLKNILKSPMVDVNLPPLLIDCSNEIDKNLIYKYKQKIKNLYHLAKALHKEGIIGPFNSVSPEIYVDFWKENGARAGTITNGNITWNNQ